MSNASRLPLILTLSALPVYGFAQDAVPVGEGEPSSLQAPSAADDTNAQAAAEASPPATAREVPETIAVQGPESEPEALEQSSGGARNRLVEEVVVTAQKREERLQDVPISISAFSAAALDAKGIDDPKSLAQSTPGVYYGQTVNFAIIYIRGVGSDAFLPDSDPSVASYIDGIYFPFANGLSQSFGAVERVEVLKGPQGTLFGRNSTGGAFNTITKSPGSTPETSILASYGEFNQLRTRVYQNIPFSDDFAASISVTYNNEDNYYTGTRGSGEGTNTLPLPKEVGKGARLKTRWDITDEIQLNLAAFKYLQDGVSSSAMPNVNPSVVTRTVRSLLNPGQGFETRPYHVAVDVPGYFALDNEVYYGQLNLHPEWFDVKVLGSKQKIKTDNVFDFDGTDTPIVLFDARGQFADVKTAELQFLSNGDWGPDWLTWIVGGFYLDQKSGFPLNRFGVAGLELSDLQLANLLTINPLLVQALSQVPIVPDGASLALTSLLGTESTAYFTQFTIDFTDDLHLTLGGRYQEEKRRIIASDTGLANLDGSITPLIVRRKQHSNTNNFSPKVSLAYDISDDVMVYGSYTEGYKSGTFNTVNIYDDAEYVKPEKVKTSELGFKSELFDRLLRFNAAVFENKIEDLQVQFISLLAGGAVNLENAGGARIRGFDFDIQLTPLPELDPGLVLMGGGTYLDSEYTDYRNGSGYSVNPQTGDYSGLTGGLYNQLIPGIIESDFTGNKVTRTPKFSGTVGFNQLFEFDNSNLEFGAQMYFNSGFYYQASNTPISKEGKYHVIDAQISYFYKPWGTRVTVFGKNINDAQYTYSQFHLDTGRLDYLAPPSTYGVRFNVDF